MKKFFRLSAILLAQWLLCFSLPSVSDELKGLFDIPNAPGGALLSQSPFHSSCLLQDNHEIYCRISAEGEAYLYKDDIKLSEQGQNLVLSFQKSPTPHTDPLGTKDVFFNGVAFTAQALSGNSVALSFQGCDQNGVCYPPERHEFNFALNPGLKTAADPVVVTGEGSTKLKDAFRENRLFDGSSSQPMQLLLALLLGIGLNLTPCVLPMLAVFSAMISGIKSLRLAKTLLLNGCYLLGLAAAYTLAGLIFAKIGIYAHAFLQHPLTLAIMSLLLLLLALNCAGAFELKIPNAYSAFIQRKIAKSAGGSLKSAFFFGVLSALIATPCTGAPLAGAILYVMQSNDLLFGSLLFLCIGVGLGLPLFAIGVFGGRLLLKAGRWTTLVKKLLALPLVAAAFYISSHLFGRYENAALTLLCAAGLSYVVYLALDFTRKLSVLSKTAICVCAFALAFLAAYLYLNHEDANDFEVFTVLEKSEDLQKFQGKPVILTFSAKWCANCHELDRTLYASPEFLKLKDDFYFLRFDLTDASSDTNLKIAKRFGIVGVPTVMILNGSGQSLGGFTGILDFEKLKGLAQQAQALK